MLKMLENEILFLRISESLSFHVKGNLPCDCIKPLNKEDLPAFCLLSRITPEAVVKIRSLPLMVQIADFYSALKHKPTVPDLRCAI